uniref:Uncharacterized protein n=1 Tax=Cacopsylla melanoneura TaxID=428564 RepID=A0A8D8VG31_9HEMI
MNDRTGGLEQELGKDSPTRRRYGNGKHHSHQNYHPRLHQNPMDSSVTGAAGAYNFSSSYSSSPLESHQQLAAMFLQNNTPAPLNPIDRLYSMQNSYFCSEDAPLTPQ